MENGNEVATKRDLAELEQRLTKDMAGLEERLLEAIHDAETRLLKAFYGYMESAQKHFVDLDRNDNSVRERLGTLEERINEIEKRLNMPPSS